MLAGIALVLEGDAFGANPWCAVKLTVSLQQNDEMAALFPKCPYVKQSCY